jgi:hypothetical protein
VTLTNLPADQPAFVFIADESPLHRKLGVYEVRCPMTTSTLNPQPSTLP